MQTQLPQFLIAIESTPEPTLREIMGNDYIDTPGTYAQEKDYYEGIFDFMQSNMGLSELERLIDWYDTHPVEVEKISAPIFRGQE